MYNFSIPMPYTIEEISKLLNINNFLKKSKITSLYACVPRGCKVFTGFEQSRNCMFTHTNWDYWKKLIEHTFSLNCDFIYLLNSPRPLDVENPDFPQQLEKLEFLLSELRKIGVKKLRIANAQLMSYIGKNHSDFSVYASTSLEYKTIWEYQNFINFHPEVKQIVISHDINKNFKIISLLKKRYPHLDFEIMVNEGCLQGCPNRMFHEYISIDKDVVINNDIYLSGRYATNFCYPILNKYPIQSLAIGNHIFPWEIHEYSKIGINNFKLVGREALVTDFEKYYNVTYMYLKGIEDIKNIENYGIANFMHHLNNNPFLKQLTVKNYKKYLPNIKHFKKYGYLCASRCGVECRYCYKCAEKIQKVFEKKQEEIKKRTMTVCTV